MRILIIGAGGLVGSAVTAALTERHDVVQASRSGTVHMDITDPSSVTRALDQVGTVDAIVACVGVVAFKPLSDLTREDFQHGIEDKVMGQVEIVRQGTAHLSDGGSFTLTSGILSREPIAEGALASLTNGALESFVMAAAPELPRGLRINAVSPTVLAEATEYHSSFPGFVPVPAVIIAQSYVKSVEGIQTGQTFRID